MKDTLKELMYELIGKTMNELIGSVGQHFLTRVTLKVS